MDLASLRSAGLDGLEQIYRQSPVGAAPSGLYRGHFLGWLQTRGANRWWVRAINGTLFERTRFGIDFDRRLWWFVRPGLAAGRFVFSPGPSRWRATECYRLEYGVSRLPVGRLLYDEVKSLDGDLALGIGGINADAGEGDHFFFALTR